MVSPTYLKPPVQILPSTETSRNFSLPIHHNRFETYDPNVIGLVASTGRKDRRLRFLEPLFEAVTNDSGVM